MKNMMSRWYKALLSASLLALGFGGCKWGGSMPLEYGTPNPMYHPDSVNASRGVDEPDSIGRADEAPAPDVPLDGHRKD